MKGQKNTFDVRANSHGNVQLSSVRGDAPVPNLLHCLSQAFNMHASYTAALAVHLHNPTRCSKFPLLHFTSACAISFSADLQ